MINILFFLFLPKISFGRKKMNSITLSTYNQIAQMNLQLNKFISQAIVAKSNVTSQLSAVINQTVISNNNIGIGNKIDTYA